MTTRFVPHSVIESERKRMTPQAWQFMQETVVSRSDEGLTFDRTHPSWARMVAVYYPPATASQVQPMPIPPVPAGDWPLVIRLIKDQAKPGDRGIGDTLHRLIAEAGLDVWTVQLRAAGIDCGCSERQSWLNARYPY